MNEILYKVCYTTHAILVFGRIITNIFMSIKIFHVYFPGWFVFMLHLKFDWTVIYSSYIKIRYKNVLLYKLGCRITIIRLWKFTSIDYFKRFSIIVELIIYVKLEFSRIYLVTCYTHTLWIMFYFFTLWCLLLMYIGIL